MKVQKLFLCACLAMMSFNVIANESPFNNFEQFVIDGVFCEEYTPLGNNVLPFKKMIKDANFRIVTFKKAEYDGFVGHEILLLRERGLSRVLGYEVLAVFRDVKGFHFLALLNASKEDVTKVVKQGLKTRNNSYETLNYYENDNFFDYTPRAKNGNSEQKSIRFSEYHLSKHQGRHMDDFKSKNSNRTIFSIGNINYPPHGIEIESCEETHSKWYKNICKKFNKKPLTWVGCADIHSELYELNLKLERLPIYSP